MKRNEDKHALPKHPISRQRGWMRGCKFFTFRGSASFSLSSWGVSAASELRILQDKWQHIRLARFWTQFYPHSYVFLMLQNDSLFFDFLTNAYRINRGSGRSPDVVSVRDFCFRNQYLINTSNLNLFQNLKTGYTPNSSWNCAIKQHNFSDLLFGSYRKKIMPQVFCIIAAA